MTGSSPLAHQRRLFLGLLCFVVTLRASAARPEGTATPSGLGTAAELMEEIRSRMSNQWDALQHIRYQALTSKMTVGRLSERVKQLVAVIASQEVLPSARPSTPDEPCDEEPFEDDGIPALADALEELLQAYTNYINTSVEGDDPRSFQEDLAKITDVLGKLRALVGQASTRTSRGIETTPAEGEPEARRREVRAGATAVLPCPVGAAGQPVTWVHSLANRLVALNGVVVVADARFGLVEVNGSPALEISDIQKKDEGLYKCFSNGTVSYELFVAEPMLEVGVPAMAARFTNQTLTCAYRGGEGLARLEWLFNGAPFFHYNPFRNAQVGTEFNADIEVIREASTPQRLVLREVDVTASGSYTCQVLLAASGRLLSDTAAMAVKGLPQPERARPAPVGVESLGDVAATAGEEATLSCRVFADEAATVSWKRLRDQRLLSTNNYSYTGDVEHRVRHEEGPSEWHLWLARVAPEDDRFECRAVGSSGGEAAAVVRLTFGEEEKVGVASVDVPSRATRFSDQTLTCKYNLGDMGLYSVRWYLNDSEFFRYLPALKINLSHQDVQVDTEKSNATRVVLREVDIRASGTYTCEVTTNEPFFYVFSKSSNMTVTDEAAVETRITTAAIGSSVEFSCEASSEDGTVSWVRERDYHILSVGNIVVDSRYSVEQGRTAGAWRLRLARVTHSDAGDYTCRKPEFASRPTRYRLVVVEPTISMEFTDNITAEAGSSAILSCRVFNLGQGTVSWIRNEDRYLTAGLFTMTDDDRFTPSVEDANVWQLRIRDVRPEDSGAYGCQVSARPPTVKRVWLTVAGAPTAEAPASSTPTICLPPFQLIGDHVCIMVETMEKRSWFDAQQYCRSQGGDLAKEDDNAYIRIYLEQHFGISGDTWTRWPFWLGGKEGGSEGVDGWRWTDGSRVAAAVWATSEPRQYPRKGAPRGTCLVLDGFQAYSASALPCHLRRRFICRVM
ncbi:obscurin-like isoform X2 [Penaeus chinensis]|uniref:obscurin-like isoform X2 n=1 Tax=Penaeus chinensis TaxID=139456 RepID=UPI001FB66CD1|nr:obscurin-like isoform X2 [Penaeus chinensis]